MLVSVRSLDDAFILLGTVSPMQRQSCRLWTTASCRRSGRLAAALERAGFWRADRRYRGLRDRHQAGAWLALPPDRPPRPDPALVEALIDLLHDHGYTNVAVVGSADSSALWAGNRDLYALS